MSVAPDLTSFDWIVVNTSGGKDSQAMIDRVLELATAPGSGVDLSRIVVVHADLGRVEWPGTPDLAARQAASYGIRFVKVHRKGADTILEYAENRGKWPSPAQRWCTSDFKRGPIQTVWTALVQEWRKAGGAGQCRILNAMGLRAQESPGRAKRAPYEHSAGKTCPCFECLRLRAVACQDWTHAPTKAGIRTVYCTCAHDAPIADAVRRLTGDSNGRRSISEWLPIHDWTTDQVWARIKASGVEHHRAYDLGMPRLSCVFCIFAPTRALVLAGRHNPELLQEYVDVEARIHHTFKPDLALAEVQRLAQLGGPPVADVAPISDEWCM